MIDIKKCCVDFYQTDLVRLLFGDSMHPGSLELTNELAEKIEIVKESKVLDVACGFGTTAIYIAKNFGCYVTGIDLSEKNVLEAKKISLMEGTSNLTNFKVSDAENIVDFGDETFDYALSECSFCLFPDKKKASEEIYRVIRKQGRIGLSDIVISQQIPQNVKDTLNKFVCILEAENERQYTKYLETAGFTNIQFYDKKYAILKLLDDIKKRIFAVELLSGLGKVKITNVEEDLAKTKSVIREVGEWINSGMISYALITGDKSNK
jgi:ubiquinone/menaquinone biosynthesis C-methylase UbiE